MRTHTAVVVTTLFIFGFVGVSTVSAGTIVIGEQESISSSESVQNASVEFYLDQTNADDGTPLSVGNFQIRVDLLGPNAGTDVKIVSIGETIAHAQARALDVKNVHAANSAFASTVNFLNPFDIDDGDGFMRVQLEVQPGASGSYSLQILTGNDDLQLIDPVDFTTPLSFDTRNGTLSIEPVPEPSSLVCVCLALAMLVCVTRSRIPYYSAI